MKNVKKVAGMFVLVLIGFSCTNKEIESRLAKLEGKMAELETSGIRTPKPVMPTNDSAVKPEGPLPTLNF